MNNDYGGHAELAESRPGTRTFATATLDGGEPLAAQGPLRGGLQSGRPGATAQGWTTRHRLRAPFGLRLEEDIA